MNRRIFLLSLVASFAVPEDSKATAIIQYSGETTVTADQAPVRSRYPDGEIEAVLKKGDKVHVDQVVSDGRGSWVQVSVMVGNKEIVGFVDWGDINIMEDINSGKVK